MHASPERKWNLLDLARDPHVSISLLDERFWEVIDVAPIRYHGGCILPRNFFGRPTLAWQRSPVAVAMTRRRR